ncbi:hypothetical protein [Burkholderia anthina]|uniref:hypothetical protein n=1 Tax=Burkholderia anthina TaxID=179879 RepID=UPI001AA02B3B|nr:hypothetical protein [Burkholderia anthina]QTD93924.1 hypothetical protein J4G50_24140 [Burkholderia anthina]
MVTLEVGFTEFCGCRLPVRSGLSNYRKAVIPNLDFRRAGFRNFSGEAFECRQTDTASLLELYLLTAFRQENTPEAGLAASKNP